MKEKKKPLKKVKVEIRHSPPALKIVLIVLIVLSMAALVTLRLVHNGIQDEIQELKEEASQVEHANSELEQKLKDPDSVQNVLDIAKEELGMVDPNTVLIDPQ